MSLALVDGLGQPMLSVFMLSRKHGSLGSVPCSLYFSPHPVTTCDCPLFQVSTSELVFPLPRSSVRHSLFWGPGIKVSGKDYVARDPALCFLYASQLCSEKHIRAVWEELATYTNCLPACGPNVAISFPLSSQGRLASVLESYHVTTSVIGETLLLKSLSRAICC